MYFFFANHILYVYVHGYVEYGVYMCILISHLGGPHARDIILS